MAYLHFKTLNFNNNVRINPMSNTFVDYGVCINRNIGVVMYHQGRIAFYDITNCKHGGISFQFTGCALAQFSHFGRKYIAHISLHEVNSIYDTRRDWNSFLQNILDNNIQAQFVNFILFRPFDETAKILSIKYYPNGNCCGIIDSQNNCFSAILDKTNNYKALQMWPTHKIKYVQNLTKFNIFELLL